MEIINLPKHKVFWATLDKLMVHHVGVLLDTEMTTTDQREPVFTTQSRCNADEISGVKYSKADLCHDHGASLSSLDVEADEDNIILGMERSRSLDIKLSHAR